MFDQCGLAGHAALFTDLYELTMVQSYLREGMQGKAVFELFFRSLPEQRNFVVAAGLDRVLTLLEQLEFTDEDLAYLRTYEQFPEPFLEELKQLRFTGDVYAPPEGTILFANEPLLQIAAPIPLAQLVETLVLNQINFASIAATKAARCVLAAGGRQVVDFGSRRAHGIDAALTVARCSYLAGAAGTSLVEAGRRYGIPTFGTMAHSYIQAHADEERAFQKFTELYPRTTLLVDTYDTLEGVRRVIDLSRRMGENFQVRAVRLDSGDLAELARRSRALLDEAGLEDVKIFASSGLNEYQLEAFVARGVPIDGFGIGTSLAVSDDAPDLDTVYKLVEYDGLPRTKLSSRKIIYPRRKQVFRQVEEDPEEGWEPGDSALRGRIIGDVMARHDADLPGEPLLQPVMQGGRRLPAGHIPLEESRSHARAELDRLPAHLKQLQRSESPYPVVIHSDLEEELEQLRRSRA